MSPENTDAEFRLNDKLGYVYFRGPPDKVLWAWEAAFRLREEAAWDRRHKRSIKLPKISFKWLWNLFHWKKHKREVLEQQLEKVG